MPTLPRGNSSAALSQIKRSKSIEKTNPNSYLYSINPVQFARFQNEVSVVHR